VHGERAGFNNTAWDARFLELFEHDPERLAQLTHAEYAELGGLEGAEVIMWLIMRGALSAQVRKLHQSYYLPSMTGIATAIYESHDAGPVAGEVARSQAAIAQQLQGADRLTGTYPFDLERSVRCLRINRFLHDLVMPEHRARFLADERGEMARAGLTAEEIELVATRDWRGLIRHGAIFFVLEKLGAVVGVSNLHIYAAMRGQTLEDFQKTRNAPGRCTRWPRAATSTSSSGSSRPERPAHPHQQKAPAPGRGKDRDRPGRDRQRGDGRCAGDSCKRQKLWRRPTA
jgi:gallate dioxygenase